MRNLMITLAIGAVMVAGAPAKAAGKQTPKQQAQALYFDVQGFLGNSHMGVMRAIRKPGGPSCEEVAGQFRNQLQGLKAKAAKLPPTYRDFAAVVNRLDTVLVCEEETNKKARKSIDNALHRVANKL